MCCGKVSDRFPKRFLLFVLLLPTEARPLLLSAGFAAFTRARPRPPLAPSVAEQDLLLGILDGERFADVAPATIFATLLDEGRYCGSIRTMYRLLAAQFGRHIYTAIAALIHAVDTRTLKCHFRM
jgi:hypothetical protein